MFITDKKNNSEIIIVKNNNKILCKIPKSKKTDSQLIDIANWVDSDYLRKNQEAIMHRLARYIGIITGIVATTYNFLYAYDFGERINAGIAGKIILGALGAFPLAILQAMKCEQFAGDIVYIDSKDLRTITYKNCKLSFFRNAIKKPYFALLGAIAAVPLVYANHQAFAKYSEICAIILDVPTGIAKVILFGWATYNLYQLFEHAIIDRYMEYLHCRKVNSTAVKRYLLQKRLYKSIAILNKLQSGEIDLLSYLFFNAQDSAKTNVTSYTKLRYLFRLVHYYRHMIINKKSALQCINTLLRSAIKIFGSVTGYLSAYVVVPLSREVILNLFKLWDLDGEVANVIASTFGYLAAFCIGSLLSYATQDSLTKFYDAFVSIPKTFSKLIDCCRFNCDKNVSLSRINFRLAIRRFLVPLSIILAVTSALPRIELATDNVKINPILDWVVVAAIAIAVSAKDFWALESFSDRIIMQKDKRVQLIKIVKQIIKMIPKISDEYILKMYDNFCQNSDSVGSHQPKKNTTHSVDKSREKKTHNCPMKNKTDDPIIVTISSNKNTFFKETSPLLSGKIFFNSSQEKRRRSFSLLNPLTWCCN